MAHFEPIGASVLNDLALGISNLAMDVDKVAQKVVNDVSPSMEQIYRSALGGSAPSYVANSTATTKAKKNTLGVFAVSRPVGYKPYSRHGRNYTNAYAMIAAFFEYGVGTHYIAYSKPNKYHLDHWKSKRYGDVHPGMDAKPWRAKAIKWGEEVLTDMTIKHFEEEVKNYFKNM